MESEDKEKLRRAYRKAVQMQLSADVQNRLKEQLGLSDPISSTELVSEPVPVPSSAVLEVSVPVSIPASSVLEGVEPIRSEPEQALSAWQGFRKLLGQDEGISDASPFFLEHSEAIFQDINTVESESELEEFFHLVQKVPAPDRLLSLTSLGRLLVRAQNDEQRLTQLAQFFATRKQKMSPEDLLTSAFFFADPLTWLTKNPSSWLKLSRFIATHHAQFPKSCHFLGVYEKNQFLMHEADLEHALWEPLRLDSHLSPWHAVAKVHLFLAQNSDDPSLLWEAWAGFQNTPNTESHWTRLQKWALSVSSEILVHQGRDIVPHLQLVGERSQLRSEEISKYYQLHGSPKNIVLQESLLDFAARLGDEELELMLLRKLTGQKQLADHQVDRLWHLGRKFKLTTLVEKIESIRLIRSHTLQDKEFTIERQMGAPDDRAIARCTFDCTLTEKKFLSSYLRLAPWVHYYVHKDLDDFRILKRREIFADSTARKFRRLAEDFPIPLPSKVLVHDRLFSANLVNEVPNFYPGLVSNPWSKTFAALVQVLALNHVSTLLEKIQAWGCPVRELDAGAIAFAKWMNRTGIEAKLNWHQFHSVCKLISEQESRDLITRFAVRLATLMCRNDALAIATLVQGPEDLRVDLEKFLLCVD